MLETAQPALLNHILTHGVSLWAVMPFWLDEFNSRWENYNYLEQAEAAKTTQIDAYWIAAGFGLQGYYTGIEKIFEQIAQVVDESFLKQSERWHQELLE